MLRSMLEMKDYTIGATDGEIGHVSDLFFDDRSWVVRYLVIETGSWFLRGKVLLSPHSLMAPDWLHKRLPVRISRDQVKGSPDIDTEMPVSRQHEMQFADYYGYPYYWGDVMMRPSLMAGPSAVQYQSRVEGDPHLRSCHAVTGYTVHATDGDIGSVKTMLIDEESWAIRYLVVDTGSWWDGHEVLIAPNWFTSISWPQTSVRVSLTREAIKSSPPFASSAALNRQQEAALHHHYQRPSYWEQDLARDLERERQREPAGL